jgi:NAD(P)-dependent dehydrogenase (short-subunit alcohol dehydrogenase family)
VQDVRGKVALVSGVGGNIGLASAHRLAELGASIVVSDVDQAVAERAAMEVGGRALSADIRQAGACRDLVQDVVDGLGRLDILVNTAGQSSFGSVLEMTEEAWRREIDTNLTGSFLIAQAAARVMVAAGRGGRIILFGSTAAESARAGGASHCASKAGVQMLAKVMALELAPHAITVNAVAPAFIDSPLNAYRKADPELERQTLASVPLGRWGSIADVVAACVFLASDAASFITGHTLFVDGGYLSV